MAMKNVGVTIIGAEYVTDTFKHVSPAEGNRIAKRTITRVAASVRDDMRQRAPEDEGTLRKAIKSRRRRGTREFAEAGVFIEHGTTAKNDAWYWWFIENGTEPRTVNKTGAKVGSVTAQPFILPTVESWRNRITEEYENEWWPQFAKEMVKRARKQGTKV